MLSITPAETPTPQMHAYLQGAVIPRPIAFASTVDGAGGVNLSPFSFFNTFGSNPPILVFSPARRGRDNTTKHTYENLREVPEVVIHTVTYNMVQQVSLASTEYARGVNEFVKAGFTEVPSDLVKPPRVGEAPIAMECKVLQIIATGDKGGAGNLVICEVVRMHIREEVLDAQGRIDPFKLDAVARLGADWYCRVQGNAIFHVAKPLDRLGIGIDQLPEHIRLSKVLTGNDLGKLGNIERLPGREAIESMRSSPEVQSALQAGETAIHKLAHQYLENNQVEDAWRILLLQVN
jgi:flavin reductase (DIM6/NTAB) family NADH-FMN oxidoreductase RutF